MNKQKDEKWLDELIYRTINTEKPQFDAERWKQRYPDEFQILRSRATQASAHPIQWASLLKSPITKFAAAAVVLLGLLMLTMYLIGSETPQHTEQTHTATIHSAENQREATRPQVVLKRELETAKQLFERQDLPGLLQLLQAGQDPTKVWVAKYLGQIGDGSVLSALQILAEQWQGLEQENPFQKAIRAIQERQVEPEPRETAYSQEPNEPQASPEASQTGVAGIVIDKNTYRPIQGAEVGFSPTKTLATDVEGRFMLIYTKPYEEAHVYVTASGYASQVITVRMKMGSIKNVTIELNPGSKLAGIVTDPNGWPIQGAKVEVGNLTYLVLCPVTDADGRFDIDGLDPVVDSYSVLVMHPMYPGVHVNLQPAPAGQTRYQEIVLKPGVFVSGQVTNSQGAPISGVTVGNTRSGTMWNNIEVETDVEGMYRLGIVEVGELVLWATHGRYAPFVEHTVLAGDQAEHHIDIQLKDARTLHGRVVDSDGNPVPEVTVEIIEYNGITNLDGRRHSCDSDGRFTIPNAPADGELELQVFGEGIAGTNHKVDFSQDECLITVDRSGKIYGKVVDATTGEPLPRFLVKMSFSQVGPRTYGYNTTWSREGHTFDSSEGLFDTGREDLPVNGQYRMTLHAEGYAPLTLDPVVVQPVSNEPNLTEFWLQPATVFAGRVIASDGQPIQGAAMVFFSNGNVQNRESWPRAVTDKAGIFTISGLGSEPQCVFVSATDFAPRVYLMTDIIETPGLLVDIILDRSASLVGRVVDKNGKGIMNARVHAFFDLGRARDVLTRFPSLGPSVRTDKDGYYQLSGVPTGQVQISVMSARYYQIGQKKVNLEPNESMELNFDDE
jgi:protocatechuate 3,4-dioxygenase beta subunit